MDLNGAFPNWYHRPWILVTVILYHPSKQHRPSRMIRKRGWKTTCLLGWAILQCHPVSMFVRMAASKVVLARVAFFHRPCLSNFHHFNSCLIIFTSPSIFQYLPCPMHPNVISSYLQSLSSHGHCKRAITGWTIDLKLQLVYAKSGCIKQRVSTFAQQVLKEHVL